MKLNKLTTALAALATAAVLGTSAQAQVFPTYNSGDLLIGFEQSGAANDYVVDLGSVSQFIDATSAVNIQLSTADLTSAFTSSWASNSQANLVQWGLVGNDEANSIAGDTDGNTVWYTKGEPTAGTRSAAPIRGSSVTQATISGDIQNLETASVGGFASTLSTADTTNGIIEAKSAGNSWTSFSPSSGTGLDLSTGVEQSLTGDTGPTNSDLDLYEVTTKTASNQPAEFLGSFSLGSNGVLTFDPAVAVPEPSAYALGLTALVLFVVLKRRTSIGQA